MPAAHRHSKALPLLLLAVFLTVQLLALAHETTHGFSAETDQCSICLRAGQYKAFAINTGAIAATVFLTVYSLNLTPPAHVGAVLLTRRARGPPAPEPL